jgi:hypothetical protein
MIELFKRIQGQAADPAESMFFENEYEVLAGNARKRQFFMGFVFFLTTLALAFAIGGLNFLEQRMDDPFTNWVDLPISPQVNQHLEALRSAYDNEGFRDSFLLQSIDEYVVFREKFLLKGGESLVPKGRTIVPGTKLFDKIAGEKSSNVITRPNPEASPNSSLIVTRTLLETLGYKQPEKLRKIAIDFDGKILYLDIYAVVKTLPNLCEFACTPNIYNALNLPIEETGFIQTGGSLNVLHWIIHPEVDAEILLQVFEDWSRENQTHIIETQFTPFTVQASSPHQKLSVIHSVYLNQEEQGKLSSYIIQNANLNPNHLHPYFEVNLNSGSSMSRLNNPYYVAFNFSRLDKVRALQEHLMFRYDIDLTMNQIEAKENFAIVSRLTGLLAASLFIFCVISIVSFLHSLLNAHLEKIKPNMGTFKAFGLSNQFLIIVYTKVILAFLGVSALSGWLAAVFVGSFIRWMMPSTPLVFLHPTPILLLLAIFLLSAYIAKRLIQHTLIISPGNLIYGRD